MTSCGHLHARRTHARRTNAGARVQASGRNRASPATLGKKPAKKQSFCFFTIAAPASFMTAARLFPTVTPPVTLLGHALLTNKSGNIFRVGIFLDFVWLTTRTHHGAYARGARRNRIDRHGGGIERLVTPTPSASSTSSQAQTQTRTWPREKAEKSGNHFPHGYFFMILLGSPHVRPMAHTRRRAGGIDLTPLGVELNGS